MKMKHYILRSLWVAVLLVAAGISQAANGIIEVQTYKLCHGDELSFTGGTTKITGDTIIYDTIRVTDPTADSIYVYVINTYPKIRHDETRELEVGSSFQWHGQTISKPGDYQDVHKSVHGCDSAYYLKVIERLPVTLFYSITDTAICQGGYIDWNGVRYTSSDTVYKLKQGAAGGRDSVYILYLKVLPVTRKSESVAFTNWPAHYRDSVLKEPGVYEFVYKATSGCDSIITVAANQQVITVPEKATICAGEKFTWQGTDYKEGGQYQKIVKTKNGKHDSIYYTLDLTVLPVKRSYVTKTICRGSSFTFNGKTYTDKDAGVITQTIKTSGCDSIVQLTLLVADADTVYQVHQLTDNETYRWNGKDYKDAGVYYYNTTNRFGCDSLVQLTLTKKHVTRKDTTVYICEGGSYTWNGITGTETNDYSKIVEAAGEVTVYTLHVIVGKTSHTWEEIQVENFPYTYREYEFTALGQHDFQYLTSQGCDSIITVVANKRVIVDEEVVTICPGQTYKWGFSSYHEYGETGIYQETEKTKDGTRDSIYHVLKLTVRYIPTTYVNATICQGESYSFGGMTYREGGTYTHKFKVDGCDSTVVLSLNVRAKDTILYAHQIKEGEIFNWKGEQYKEPGVYDLVGTNQYGCDSVLRLILTHHHVDTVDTAATICQGETFEWHGIRGRETHKYTNIETLPNGDQVYYRLDLTVKSVSEVPVQLTMCQGTNVNFNGKSYSQPGTYYDRYNCDTIYKVVVTMNPVRVFVTNATLVGDSYTWEYGGQTKDIAEPGTYTEEVTNADGCTDTYRLILNKDNTPYYFEESLTVCEGEDFIWRGRSGLSSQGIGTTTDYKDEYKTVAGKDSIYTLHLTVMPLKRSSRAITFCTQTVWKGKTYTESAVVYDTIASSVGCDSIVRIYLDKAPTYLFHDTATIVEGEVLEWFDKKINQAGLYRMPFTSIHGCDSIYEIGVALIPAVEQQPIYTTKWSICEGDIFTWDVNGREYKESGTYKETVKAATIGDPDTLYILNLSVWPSYKDTIVRHQYICGENKTIRYNGQEYDKDTVIIANFRTIHNCDSIVKMFLHFNTTLFQSDTLHLGDNDTTRIWYGQKINHAGIYRHNVPAEGECYNREELVVYMHPTYRYVKDTAICQTEAPYIWYDGPQDPDMLAREYSHPAGETKTYEKKYLTTEGYDSIYVLNLTIYPVYELRQQMHFCEHEDIFLNGKHYKDLKADSIYRDTTILRSRNNCDSVIYTEIVQHPVKETSKNIVLHNNETYEWHGKTISKADIYRDTFPQAVSGCDSIISLWVTQEMTQEKYVCILDTPFVWRSGKELYTSGIWHDTTWYDNGFIRELWTLDLTITTPPDTTIYLHGCDKKGVTWRDKTYLRDTVDTVFVPIIPYNPKQPCDSVFTVKVRIDTTYQIVIDTVLCEHELPLIIGRQNPDTIWAEGTWSPEPQDTTACGCDSLLTVNLRIIPSLTKNDSIIVCERDIKENPVILGDTIHPAFVSSHGTWTNEALWKGDDPKKWHGVKYWDDTIVWNCDKSYFFHVIVKPQVINNDTIYLCEGDSMQLGWPKPVWIKNQGVYYDTLQSFKPWMDEKHGIHYNPNDFSCDSITRYEVIFTHPIYTATTKHIPQGDSILWGEEWRHFTGDYISITDAPDTNYLGQHCKKIDTLHLFVEPTYHFRDTIDVCYDPAVTYSHVWDTEGKHVQYFNAPKTDMALHYYDSLLTKPWRFDSIYDLYVNFHSIKRTKIAAGICEGDSMRFGLTRANRPRYISKSAVYYDTLVAHSNGCDSIIELTLNVYPKYLKHRQIDIADTDTPYVWERIQWICGIGHITRENLLASGEYSYHLESAYGCDSIDSISLRIHSTYLFRDTVTICQNETPYTWKGEDGTIFKKDIYTQNTYIKNLQTKDGYDSTYIRFVRILPIQRETIQAHICEGDSMRFGLTKANRERFVSKSGTYQDTLRATNGCDSIVTLVLNVYPKYLTHKKVDITESTLPYIWEHPIILANGQKDTLQDELYASGEYSRMLKSAFGCDSIDSLSLRVHKTYQIIEEITVCETDTAYQWEGNAITESGTYTAYYQTIDGYDSVRIANITVHSRKYTTIHDSLCEGDSIRFGLTKNHTERFISKPGTYRDTMVTVNGCDSIITLHLNVFPKHVTYNTVDIADVDTPYVWEHVQWICGIGHIVKDSLYAAGKYEYKMKSVYGCDSIDSLTLRIHNTYLFNEEITICERETPYTWQNRNDITKSGTYYYNPRTKDNYDSIYIATITVIPTIRKTINHKMCEGSEYLFDGKTFKRDTTVVDTLMAANGCDSIVTLILTVNKPYHHIEKVHILQGQNVKFFGETYDKSGTYTHYGQTPEGCDSTSILQLTVHPLVDTIITVCSSTLPYPWYNKWSGKEEKLYAAGTYRNDSTFDGQKHFYGVQLIVNDPVFKTINHKMCEGSEYLFDGKTFKKDTTVVDTLMAANGCDSIVTLILTVNKPYHHIEKVHILQGQNVKFFGETYDKSGTYTHYGQTPEGCDSTSILQLTVHPLVDTIITVCSSTLPYPWYNKWSGKEEKLYAAGTYRNDSTFDGQKHFYGVQLIVNEPVFKTINHKMCEGSEYLFDGKTFKKDTTVVDTLMAANGCDSIVTLILTVNKPYHHIEKVHILQGQNVKFFGETYDKSGTYTHYGQTPEGCDSTSILQLTVHPLVDTIITVCSSTLPYPWYNKWSGKEEKLYAAGTYRNDSTFDGQKHFYGVQLIVNEPVFKTINHKMCEGSEYLFDGKTFKRDTTVVDTLMAANGCDSIVTLILTVNKPYHHIEKVHILQGQNVKFFGETYDKSGTYTHYGQTPEGCDSTSILQLTVHPLVDTIITVCSSTLPYPWYNKWSGKEEKLYAAGTYRNDSTFDGQKHFYGVQLIVNDPVFKTINHKMCEGSEYLFDGKTFKKDTTVVDTLMAANGCDSIVTLILTVNKPYHHIEKVHILQGQNVKFFGETYDKSGTYTHYGQTPEGCDSTSILQLTVHPLVDTIITVCSSTLPYPWYNKWSGKEEKLYAAGTYRNDSTFDGQKHFYGVQLVVNDPVFKTINHTMCQGSEYYFGGKKYTNDTIVKDTLRANNGCDSVVTLILTVRPYYYNITNLTIYEGESVTFEGDVFDKPGRYPYRYPTSTGCDSIVELNLTVRKLYDDSVSICFNALPFEWRGKEIYQSGVYRDTTYDSEGTQIISGMCVTVLPVYRAPEPVVKTICEGDYYEFNGQKLTEAKMYYDTLTARNGCDSIISLSLQVIPQSIQSNTKLIYEGDSVFFNGEWKKESGIYEYTEKGEYGCVNTYRLVVTVLKQFKMDTTAYVCSNELPFVWHGISYNEDGDYTVPTSWTDSSRVMTTLHLHIRPSYYYESNISICEGSTFIYKGKHYSKKGYFYDTIPSQNGCDSIIRYNITVHPTFDRIDTIHISDKQTYNFNGRPLTQSGYYETSDTTIHGCDSLTHLVLIVHPSYYNFDSINLCQGDTLIWHEQKIFKSGLYSDSLLTVTHNFDSVYQVRVIVHEKYFIEQQYEITEGYPTYLHGINISKPGVYYDSLLTIHGCDSVYQIVVNWARKFTQHQSVTICQGDYYDFFGTRLTHAGEYDHTSLMGDSTIYLHLTVNPTSISEERIVISSEDLPYIYKERTYEEGGTYTYHHQNRYKCDSVSRLVLVVTDHVSDWEQIPLCPGQTLKIDGKTITEAGSYTFTKRSKVTGLLDSLYRVEVYDAPAYESPIDSIVLCEGDTAIFADRQVWRGGSYTANLKTKNGCDSILHMHLTINPSYLFPTSATITDYQTYTWRGKEYTKTGLYEQSYPTIKDCDSTYQLNLIVLETQRIVVTDSICYRDTLRWRDHILSEPGIYSDTICNFASMTSIIYTLQLGVIKPTIISSATVTETAADVESFDIHFTYTGLRPTTYSIQFDEPAHKEGFVDIVNKPFGADIVAVVPMPHKEKVVYQEHTAYVRPNYYTMRLALDNSVCGISRSDSLSLLIRYPSWILEQNWDDVVVPLKAEYNGGYEFGAYTWYVNDAVFPNDGLPYLHTKSLNKGDKVVLYATRIGESYAIPTAPLVITAPMPNVFPYPVLVYPTATSKMTPHVTLQAQANGTYRVYSATGQLFSTGGFESGEQTIDMPATSGCCLIQATTEDGYTMTQKILVY